MSKRRAEGKAGRGQGGAKAEVVIGRLTQPSPTTSASSDRVWWLWIDRKSLFRSIAGERPTNPLRSGEFVRSVQQRSAKARIPGSTEFFPSATSSAHSVAVNAFVILGTPPLLRANRHAATESDCVSLVWARLKWRSRFNFLEPDDALAQEKSLEDFANSLGVSLMTLHRWRTEYGSTDLKASANHRLTEFLATH